MNARADAAFAASARTIDRSILVFGVIALVGSVLLSPSSEAVTLFGYDLPVMCSYRAFTGMDCPGCGLTRSFTFMGHLQPLQAFASHMAGPFAYVAVVAQVPYRAWRLYRNAPGATLHG
jgi:hypothetical protein